MGETMIYWRSAWWQVEWESDEGDPYVTRIYVHDGSDNLYDCFEGYEEEINEALVSSLLKDNHDNR